MNSTLTSAGPEHMTRIRDISAQERGERGDFCMRPWYGVGKVRAVPPHVGRQPKPLHTAGDHPAMPSGTHGRWKDWGRAKSGGEGHDAAHLPFSWTSAEFAATSFLLPCFGRAAMARARGGESIENDARKQRSDRILIQGGQRGFRLDRQAWRDLRRACKLGDSSNVHSVECRADGVRIVFKSQNGSLDSSGPKSGKNGQHPQATRSERGRSVDERKSRPPNSRQRRSAQRMQEYIQQKGSEPPEAATPLNAAAPEFQMPKRVEPDVQVADEAPASPRREQRALLLEASESLAKRQEQRQVAQPRPAGQRPVESTDRQHGNDGKRPRGGREGPGLRPPSKS